jgi:hypothetical protein
MVLDAGVYAMLGNTPGKALVGITVTSVDGRRLSYGNALRRNFGVYWSGLGTGFPIVTLGTVLRAHSIVSGGQLTSWDKNVGSQVLGRTSGIRTWVGAAAYFVLLVGLAQLNAAEKASGAAAAATSRVDTLREAVRSVNAMAPKMVDKVTRLDGAEIGPGTAFTYLYTLTTIDSATMKVDESARAAHLEKVRTDYCRGGMKSFRDANVAVQFKYRDHSGLPFTLLSVSPSDCL